MRAGKEDAAPGSGDMAAQPRPWAHKAALAQPGPWSLGVVLTKHSLILHVCSVLARYLSCFCSRSSAAARRASLEACREAQAGRWHHSPGTETWCPLSLGQVLSFSQPLMGRGGGGPSLYWVQCPGEGCRAATTSGISCCRPAEQRASRAAELPPGMGQAEGHRRCGPTAAGKGVLESQRRRGRTEPAASPMGIPQCNAWLSRQGCPSSFTPRLWVGRLLVLGCRASAPPAASPFPPLPRPRLVSPPLMVTAPLCRGQVHQPHMRGPGQAGLCSCSNPVLQELGHALAQTSGGLLGTAQGDGAWGSKPWPPMPAGTAGKPTGTHVFGGHGQLLSPAGPARAGLRNICARLSGPARAGSAGSLPLGSARGGLSGERETWK